MSYWQFQRPGHRVPKNRKIYSLEIDQLRSAKDQIPIKRRT